MSRNVIVATLLLTLLVLWAAPTAVLAGDTATGTPVSPTAPPVSRSLPAAWTSSGGDAARNSVTDDSLRPALYVRWKLPLDGASLTTPVVAEGRVYAGTFAGTVYGAEAVTGRQLWTFRLAGTGHIKVRGISYDQGRLFVVSETDMGGSLVALDVSGDAQPTQLWQVALPDRSFSAPLVAGGLVTVGCNDSSGNGTLVALDAATGKERWRQQLFGDVWRSNQAASGDTLIALSYMGQVMAYDLKTGAQHWSQNLGGFFEPGASPVIVGDTVYVASSVDWAGKVAAFNLASGARRWVYETDRQDNLWVTPVVARGAVIAPLQGTLYSLDAATGSLKAPPLDLDTYRQAGKTYRPTLHTPVVGSDVLWQPTTFEVNGPQQIYAFDARAGAISGPSLWRSCLPARLGSGLAYSGGILYFTGQDSYLYAMSAPVVRVDGKDVAFPDVPAHFSATGRLMVPLRFVLEATGASVDWMSETRAVVVRLGNTVIELHQDSRDVTVNGVLKTMDTAVGVVGDRTVVPLRFLTDWLGGSIDWDQRTLTATLHLPGAPEQAQAQ